MVTYDELNNLQAEKASVFAKEQRLLEQRKMEIAQLAQNYGLLTLSDDEICLAFQRLVSKHTNN